MSDYVLNLVEISQINHKVTKVHHLPKIKVQIKSCGYGCI